MKGQCRQLELLSPARDLGTAKTAIDHGADAVYIGAEMFGARASAGNSVEDIAEVVRYARPFGVKVYVTVNTIVFDDETEAVRELIVKLWDAGVDALIVQDMGILEMEIPEIELHASTQTDARNPEKIKMLREAGFSQIVLPREFSLEEIREAREAAGDVRLEAFVHGALCVSYSGDCQAGAMLMGRSGNRGECPQICRLSFTLTDKNGKKIENLPDGGGSTRHWLSLADMNRLDYIGEMADAGISSFKIEGRLKSESYVKNITSAYSRALDSIVAGSDGKYSRSSYGRARAGFEADASRSFNRGFTSYFLIGGDDRGITSYASPKWVGREIGTVESAGRNTLKIKAKEPINNGDGIGYFDEKGEFGGFRVNRVDGDWLTVAPGSTIPQKRGTRLYRNFDAAWEKKMNEENGPRRLGVRFSLERGDEGRVVLRAEDERGCAVRIESEDAMTDKARSNQTEYRRGIMSRLGETHFELDEYEDGCPDVFIPAKVLSEMRRNALDRLDSEWEKNYKRGLRRKDELGRDAFEGYEFSYHDNVSNRLAERFYEGHGGKNIAPSVEKSRPEGDVCVMTSRYCLRRELGACLKTSGAKQLPRDLYLEAPAGRLRLDFDCEKCNMRVVLEKKRKYHERFNKN